MGNLTDLQTVMHTYGIGFVMLVMLFLLIIGSLFSFGILRLFQQKIRHGIIMLGTSAVSVAVFIVILNTWFV
ncbi:hypothetical protein ABNB59_04995 [Paenibacillus larvae]|nr:hypothetical protein [Paenibacillus larvae]AQR79283.1 hypothetical protein BXP28_20745 [Paenibacillus larvae subsp. larvae]AQT85629.1 hypothetical protein B1222_16450 [Paenibacillus larvae subsp. pulvifaciens]AQZ47643.1 hypothetical protein B5S25_14730 [Paenibacillus larvae subsp. pulvifaciens]ARF69006.1 hypothetical protein B7C51_16150 [Paenibacillus larvae subsp. pulvifaciens]AVF23551.1 hypothetical protein ERICI_03812 [Paenibacillus larvae subsp. larvae]